MSADAESHPDRPTRRVALFDIDGTLVDSNYLHVQAWSEALAEIGVTTGDARVHRAIGMDSQKLLDVLAPDADEADRERATRLNSEHYRRLMPRLRAFEGARRLLRELADHGVTVVLATSAPLDELAELRKVLDADDVIAFATSADDVDIAKPEPDLLHVALARSGATADEAVMIGDAVWDGEAARRAGIAFMGVRSGGTGHADLVAAGASAVYDDVGDLLGALADGPLGGWLR